MGKETLAEDKAELKDRIAPIVDEEFTITDVSWEVVQAQAVDFVLSGMQSTSCSSPGDS